MISIISEEGKKPSIRTMIGTKRTEIADESRDDFCRSVRNIEEAVKIMSSSGWVVLRGFLTKFIENMWEGVVGCMATLALPCISSAVFMRF